MVYQDHCFTDFRISEAHAARVSGFGIHDHPGGLDPGQFLPGHFEQGLKWVCG
jgi:hypothetical protein